MQKLDNFTWKTGIVVGVLLLIGSVGAMDLETISVWQGVAQSAVAILLFGNGMIASGMLDEDEEPEYDDYDDEDDEWNDW